MGSCTGHSLSASAESAERTSPSEMQRCKVIPPTGQNLVSGPKTPLMTNMATAWVKRRGIIDHPPSWRSSTVQYLFLPGSTINLFRNLQYPHANTSATTPTRSVTPPSPLVSSPVDASLSSKCVHHRAPKRLNTWSGILRTSWYVLVGVPVLPVPLTRSSVGRRIFLALSLPVSHHR
jgi:hypothetical protein